MHPPFNRYKVCMKQTFPTNLREKLAKIWKIYFLFKNISLIYRFNWLFHTIAAKTTPSSSKWRSKCTSSVDPFPVYPIGQMEYLVLAIWTSAATAKSDWALPELYLFPMVTEALVGPKIMVIPSKTTGNGYAWRTQRPRRTSWIHTVNRERVDRVCTL